MGERSRCQQQEHLQSGQKGGGTLSISEVSKPSGLPVCDKGILETWAPWSFCKIQAIVVFINHHRQDGATQLAAPGLGEWEATGLQS